MEERVNLNAGGWMEVSIPVLHPRASFTSTSSYTIRNLEVKTVYDVVVTAKNQYGVSDMSNVFNFYNKQNGNRIFLDCNFI